jgi:hypothetical protein
MSSTSFQTYFRVSMLFEVAEPQMSGDNIFTNKASLAALQALMLEGLGARINL